VVNKPARTYCADTGAIFLREATRQNIMLSATKIATTSLTGIVMVILVKR
jgi:hypothetical protein